MVWAFAHDYRIGFPNSFVMPVSSISIDFVESITGIFGTLYFFSLVSITTAGYGDVTPISQLTRSLTALELLVGQVSIAILVAWLVGMYITHSLESKH